MPSVSALIDRRIAELRDWRGATLAHVRGLIHRVNPEIMEELKWRGTPVFSLHGILCTAETYKTAVKLTFAHGASLPDPAGLFNASLEGKVRRAIDLHEGDQLNEAAFRQLIQDAIAFNQGKSASRR